MKKLEKLLKGHKYICFMDFEGTQISHEMIALGATMCTLDKNGNIKKEKEPFKIYVKPKNKVGNIVTKLTGITDELLAKEAVSFNKAMLDFKKYCGMAFKKCSFLTFGNHDMKILGESVAHNLTYPKEVVSQIQKNYVDYQVIIAEFIRDENYNPLSLVHYCELFNVKEAGVAHDPSVDAVNLAHIYQAFLDNKDLVLEEYLKLLTRINNLPEPVKVAIKALANGNDFKAEEFKQTAKDYIG